ncbi:MAG: AAA family ATPase, partial [Chloroflexota bacterium]
EIDVDGKIIAVFSLRGGSGVSTLSANIACGMSSLWGCETVLADINLTAGQSALFLNLPLKHSLANIADVPIEEIDLSLLQSILLGDHGKTKVLAAPPRPEFRDKFTGEKVGYILNMLKRQYEYIVLDLPHDFSETTLAALDVSDEIVLILTPEIAGVRSALMALHTFSSLEYSANLVKVMSNWIFENQGIGIEKIESILRKKVDLEIPFAGQIMLPALNYGLPVVLSQADSPMGALFEDLAFALSKPEHNRSTPEKPTDAWQRVAKRVKRRRQKIG